MFFTDNSAYDFIPARDQLELVKNSKNELIILNYDDLTDYTLNDNQIRVIDLKLEYKKSPVQ